MGEPKRTIVDKQKPYCPRCYSNNVMTMTPKFKNAGSSTLLYTRVIECHRCGWKHEKDNEE